jgi:hypothetical protein
MLFPVDQLPQQVQSRVAQWEAELVTATETVGFLLDSFVQTLLDNPEASIEVCKLLAQIPESLRATMAERLKRSQHADGRWEWPLGGILLNPGEPGRQKVAGPREERAIRHLIDCLTPGN